MTLNKSQGQTLRTVGLDLRCPVFTHGQLYVALSRATNVTNLTVLLPESSGGKTTNTRYRIMRQGDRDFNDFWAEFQRLAAELDHSEGTLIDDLIEKSHYTIQQ